MSAFSQLAEQALQGGEGEEDVEKKIEEALACPCIADLKEGPCGQTFVTAFTCFIRSEHEDKGMDCLPQFKLFQGCLRAHPEHVARLMEDPEEEREHSSSNSAATAVEAAGEDKAVAGSAPVGAAEPAARQQQQAVAPGGPAVTSSGGSRAALGKSDRGS